MDGSTVLATLNAGLNATCAVLLFAGRRRILRGERLPHSRLMVAALAASTTFLISYLSRVYLFGGSKIVAGPILKTVYYVVLTSHTILAITLLPLVGRTLFLALRNRFVEHRRIARWTWPIWSYVSVTGVLVYVMLYHLADGRIPMR